MIFAFFLMVILAFESSMGSTDVKSFVDKLNEIRGEQLVQDMNKLKADTSLSLMSICVATEGDANKAETSTTGIFQVRLLLKSGGRDGNANDLQAFIRTMKTTYGSVIPKYNVCASTISKTKCKIYFMLMYGPSAYMNVQAGQCHDAKTFTVASFSFSPKDTGYTEYAFSKNADRQPCNCPAGRTCEILPPSGEPITSRLCAIPSNVDQYLVWTLHKWRSAAVALSSDKALETAAKTKADYACAQENNLNDNGNTLVTLMKDGSKTDSIQLGLDALLSALNSAGDKTKYSDCTAENCKAFLILKSNKFTKVGIAAQKCRASGADKTIVVFVLSPAVSSSELDEEYLPLAVLNNWRKSVVSTVTPVTSTAAIKSKVDTEVAKCATAVNVEDAEVVLVSEKLGSKVTDVAAIRDQIKATLDGYKTAANSIEIQLKCSALTGEDQRKCKIFFMMIYAAYTNGDAVVKNDCSDAKTVFTFALSKKLANYDYVNPEGGILQTTTSTTEEAANSTSSAASTVSPGLGYGASLLLIVSLRR